MADKQYLINREELFKAFGNPRTVLQFEEFQRRFGTVETQTTVAVAATEALKDGTFLTLSANAELTNERVLSLGDGLAYTLGPGTFVLGLSDEAARTNGYRVTFAAAGDSSVMVPLTGRLATEEWVNDQGFSTGGGSGTVTSVGLTVPSGLSVAGSPVTTTGTLAISTTLSGYVKGNGSGFTASATIPTTDLSGTLQAAQFPALTGDVTTAGGALATTIAPSAVTLAKMANLAANSIIGNNTGSPATPLALTGAQVKTLLAITSADLSDFNSATRAQTEAELVAGTNITITPSGSGATRQLTIAASGSGGGASGTTTVNFGAFPGASDTSVAITGQTGILAGSAVDAWIIAKDTADHSADEHWLDGPEVVAGNIVAGTGFTIYARSPASDAGPTNDNTKARQADRPRPYGQWSVAWQWR